MAVGGFANVQQVGRPTYGPTGLPPGSVLNTAIAGARKYKDSLGLPSFEDITSKFGGGQGTREYGNAGAAGAGATYARGDVDRFRGDLEGQKAELATARNNMRNPTGTKTFQDVSALNSARLSHASEDADRRANEAARRRGFAGGYDPAQTERDRLEVLGTSNAEAAGAVRDAEQKQFGLENDLYGNEMQGYGHALDAYTALTKTQAELPTKYLDSYSNLLGSLAPNFGSIFGTALSGAEFDENRESKLLREKYGLEQQGADAAEERRRAGGEYDFAAGQRRAPIAAGTQRQVGNILDPRAAALEQRRRAGAPTY